MSLLSLNLKIAGNHVITKILNLLLPLAGITLMLAYEYCDTSCTYLRGSFLGLDLKWVGIIYMAVLFLSAFFAQEALSSPLAHVRTILISSGVGVEFFLIGFQVVKDTYCPFCLIFSACIFILFGVNFGIMNKRLMTLSIVGGFAGFALLFEGSVTPVYNLSLTNTGGIVE